MNITQLKEKVRLKQTTVGTWAQIPSPEVAHLLAHLGYDWVVADLEHAAFTRSNLPNFFRAVKLGGAVPIARIADNTRENIKAALDSGAEGLIFPMIENRTMLNEAISLSLYPDHNGTRGVGYCAANVYGYQFDEYTQSIAPHILFVAQIEHKNALEHLDDILSHPNLDALIVGPYDLSASFGVMGQINHPTVQKALQLIQEKANEHSIPMGLHIVKPDSEALQNKINEGYVFIAYGIDTVFLWENAKLPSGVNK